MPTQGHLRTRETSPTCSSPSPSLGFGLPSVSTKGKHGPTPLGDLATIVCSYDHTMGYSSNSLSSYFHDIYRLAGRSACAGCSSRRIGIGIGLARGGQLHARGKLWRGLTHRPVLGLHCTHRYRRRGGFFCLRGRQRSLADGLFQFLVSIGRCGDDKKHRTFPRDRPVGRSLHNII